MAPPRPVRCVVLTEDDWPLWRELRLAALTEAPYAFSSTLAQWQGEGDREERWRERLRVPGLHLAGLLADEPVALASGVVDGLDGERPGMVRVISMWVAPVARGTGVADALLVDLERWASTSKAEALTLDVMVDNPRARTVYERHGYAVVGPVEPDEDDEAPQVRMDKPLRERVG